MLTQMRAHVHGFLAKALLLFLVLTFAVWGIGDMVRGVGHRDIAQVGNESIAIPEYQQALYGTKRMLEASGMRGIQAPAIAGQVLEQMISERLIRQYATTLGLWVNEALLASELRGIDALRQADGTFDAKAFKAYLSQQRLTEAGFLAQLQREIKTRVVSQSLGVDDMVLPPNYLALKALAAGETRDVVVVTLKPNEAAPPSDEAIQTFYDQQKALRFMEPETRDLEYATFTEAQIKATLGTLGSDRDAALQDLTHSIEDALAAGKSMREALENAKLSGTIASLKNVTLGSTRDETISKIIAYGFELGQGETSSLQHAKNGSYFLVNVSKITPAAPKPLSDVKTQVVASIKAESARNAATEQAKSLAEQLKKTADWQAVLKENTLRGETLRGIARQGKSALPASLHAAVFERGLHEVAGPYTLPNGDTKIAITTAIHHKNTVAFDEATKARIAQDVQNDIQSHFMQALAREHKVTVNEQAMQSFIRPDNE